MDELVSGAVDRNGDGDLDDRVLHVYDGRTGTIWNTALAAREVILDGNRIAVAVHEYSQGMTDLNGDGDAADEVVHVVTLP